jgi:hypothetical protein
MDQENYSGHALASDAHNRAVDGGQSILDQSAPITPPVDRAIAAFTQPSITIPFKMILEPWLWKATQTGQGGDAHACQCLAATLALAEDLLLGEVEPPWTWEVKPIEFYRKFAHESGFGADAEAFWKEVRINPSAYRKLVKQRPLASIRADIERLRRGRSLADDSDNSPRLLKEYELIQDKFGDRLRYNTLFNQVELDDEPFDPSMAKVHLTITHRLNLKGCREDIADIIMLLARARTYSPVIEYLDFVSSEHGSDTAILDGLAARYFGKGIEPIHEALVRKFLISAVARAFRPGCKVDSALILQGRQGTGKSTFFRILASADWFDDSLGSASDKDERLKIHRAWIVEWAELEAVFGRKDIAAVKAFVTCAIDQLRPPYGRSIEALKRASVFVGTTNQPSVLGGARERSPQLRAPRTRTRCNLGGGGGSLSRW